MFLTAWLLPFKQTRVLYHSLDIFHDVCISFPYWMKMPFLEVWANSTAQLSLCKNMAWWLALQKYFFSLTMAWGAWARTHWGSLHPTPPPLILHPLKINFRSLIFIYDWQTPNNFLILICWKWELIFLSLDRVWTHYYHIIMLLLWNRSF